jgi:uncharacterized protein (DUF1330 family)
MPAYAIGRLQMRDPSWLEKYRATVPSIVAKHGGRYLVRGGKMEMLEGTGSLPSSFVILEFPTMNDARAFYSDPDYAPFIKLRQAGSDLEFVLVEGL